MDGLFKTAVGGFKKEDVLSYIDKQESDFRSKETDYKKQLSQSAERLDQEQKARQQQEAKAAEISDALEAVTRKNVDLAKQLEEARTQAEAAAEDIDRAHAEAGQLRQEIQRLEQERSRQAEELRAKDAAIERLKDAGSRSEQSEERISRVLVEAQATADRIVENARRQAEDILARAKGECDALVETADAFRRDVTSLRSEIGGAAGRLDGTLLTMEDASEKFRTVYAHAFDGGEEGTSAEESAAAYAETDTASEDTAPGGIRFDFSASHPQE